MKSKINLLLVVSVFIVASPLRAGESLSWQQCVTETRVAHPDLSLAFALLQQAEATKNVTGGSLLPQFSLGLNSLKRGSSSGGSSLVSSYSLSAQQLLYDGHKTSSAVASNNEAIMAAQYNYGAVSAAVRFALKSSFTALLKAQNLVGLTIEIAERRQKNVRLITLRYQGGRENIGSLRQAEADLAQAEFEVAQAKRGLVLAQTALASALGRDVHGLLRVQGAFKAGDLSVEKPDLGLLVNSNPQFQQLNARTKAARYDLDATKSVFSPQLYLTSSVGRSSPDRWPVDAVDWSAGLSLSIPIYEGGSGGARVASARAVVDQQSAQERSGFLQLFDALEQSWKSFQDARQAVVVRKKFLDAAIERATIASAQYSNGLISFNDWVMIEDNLVSTKKEYLNAGADMLIAEALWIQSKGGGLDGKQE